MREYEAMIIAKADLPDQELTKMVSKWETIIGNNDGQVVKKDTWGIRRLSYPIQKQIRGNYMIYDVATTQENIIELERVLKLDENVLRCMIIKLADSVDVEQRRLELQQQAEAAAKRAAEAARDRAEFDSFAARRGQREE